MRKPTGVHWGQFSFIFYQFAVSFFFFYVQLKFKAILCNRQNMDIISDINVQHNICIKAVNVRFIVFKLPFPSNVFKSIWYVLWQRSKGLIYFVSYSYNDCICKSCNLLLYFHNEWEPNESHMLIHSAKIRDILDLTWNMHYDNSCSFTGE